MGIYLNQGNEVFSEICNSDIYIDKTMMIKEINHYIDCGNKYICISRPRRFGKTVAGNMLAAYYSKGCNSFSIFIELKIGKIQDFQEKLNRYNVIQIDMNSEYQNTLNKDKLISRLTNKVKKEMTIEFPDVEFGQDGSLAEYILDVYAQKKETFTDRDDLFTYLIHLGYLAYDPEGNTGIGTCRIPNKEVRQEWVNALRKVPEEYAVTTQIVNASKELLYDTWRGNSKAVEEALDRSHIHVTSNRSYNNEDALQSAIRP